jgi:hypothetical protein
MSILAFFVSTTWTTIWFPEALVPAKIGPGRVAADDPEDPGDEVGVEATAGIGTEAIARFVWFLVFIIEKTLEKV